ncbi:hypothetical protein [Burkholderia plantarii]|uniref:hypothetical protein n=1 Tax=Burkholderia plantarii TaxID=41899 RepID=UPI0006D89C15|nr:hypothetical protein [Burkholderia plantarii]ALK32741.1 putative bacteriophage protein [Burkholderia plantarii]GLZ22824.1 hypothetical protein Bpla01_63530 [Burkholderia plantarii]
MAKKLFLYSTDAATGDTQKMFKNKGYEVVALTNDPAFFWKQIDKIEDKGFLAIMSHGDDNGFLMVDGTSGKDMTDTEIDTFGTTLQKRGITLYLLSCHTGRDPFCAKLLKTHCRFAAPIGYAEVKSTSQSLSVYSVTDPKAVKVEYPGWGGDPDLCPRRAASALNIL